MNPAIINLFLIPVSMHVASTTDNSAVFNINMLAVAVNLIVVGLNLG